MQKSEGIGDYDRAFLRLGMGIAGPETGHQQQCPAHKKGLMDGCECTGRDVKEVGANNN